MSKGVSGSQGLGRKILSSLGVGNILDGGMDREGNGCLVTVRYTKSSQRGIRSPR